MGSHDFWDEEEDEFEDLEAIEDYLDSFAEEEEEDDPEDEFDEEEDDEDDEDEDNEDEDDEDEDDEEEEDVICWEDYEGYPFAMEIVNGEVISMTEAFIREVFQKMCEVADLSERKLVRYLTKVLRDDEEQDEDLEIVNEAIDNDLIEELFGFDPDNGTFSFREIGFLGASNGWTIMDFLESLGYTLYEEMDYGAHGHDTNGVYYYD